MAKYFQLAVMVTAAAQITFLLAAMCHAALLFETQPTKNNEVGSSSRSDATPTFTVDHSPQCNCFRKDGQPYRYISGTMHYFQVPYGYWPDRMAKMQAGGLNALQTYISWNMHEPFKEVYNFDEQNNVFEYFDLAKNMSLDVVVRIGPFINAERDNGGLPFWLLNINPKMRPRTSDPTYQAEVKAWYDVLLPRLKPHLYINGGNILTVQIENEYGFNSVCDKKHLQWLYDLAVSHLGTDVVYFTTDNGHSVDWVRCGKVNNATHTTIDFGVYDDAKKMFDTLRQVEPSGPAVNSEYYPGWIVRWNDNYTRIEDEKVTQQMENILQYENSSCVNIYPIHGGTNFGFGAGGKYDAGSDSYSAFITSYDFNAPITENGDTTSKYMKIRELTRKYLPNTNPLPDVPANITRAKSTVVPLRRCGDLFSNLNVLTTLANQPLTTDGEPQTYEEVLLDYGFALYEHIVSEQDIQGSYTTGTSSGSMEATLNAPGIHDRAIVFVDGVRKGFFCRICRRLALNIGPLKVGQKLSLMSENQGRACFGADSDAKGLNIGSSLTISFAPANVVVQVLRGWTMVPIPVNETALWSQPTATHEAISGNVTPENFVPARYDGTFMTDAEPALGHPADTFLRLDAELDGWQKGVVLVNGRNLGRYWPSHSAQVTFYVPGVWLRSSPEVNYITLFESDYSRCEDSAVSKCEVSFVTNPVLDKPMI